MARVAIADFETEIRNWLRKIVLALKVDRGTLWERAPSGEFIVTCWWARPGIPGPPHRMRLKQISAWATGRILARDTVVWSDVGELPKEERQLRRFVKAHGPRANVTLPLEVGGVVLGAMSFGKFHAPRYWSSRELQRLRIVAQVVAGALDRKRSTLESRTLRQELALASRRSTAGQLSASIAHEINQPLTAILSALGGLARLLTRADPKPEQTSAIIHDAIEDTKRAGEIVRRLRGMFKGDEFRKIRIDVGTLAREMVKLVSSEAMSRDVALQLEISSPAQLAIGDPVQVQQCMLNLLMNAFDAAAQTRTGASKIGIKIDRDPNGWIAISVRDNGPGIDPSVASRIFEPFVTTKRKGLGMGLLVTRSIVELHGGRIWATPNADGGSTFTFTLPPASVGRSARSRFTG
jgi:signal transduction histidine kinase